jgi:arylsulfatase A-like enzyme
MNKQTRRQFLKTAGSVAVSGGLLSRIPTPVAAVQIESQRKRPNIIFIMTDDHAAHAISCYGSKINKTPNLDRLAREGMRFNNCFCTNSICAPSRAVILTGKYSHLNGVIDNAVEFDGSQQTFPKLLQKASYKTAIIGKWHLKSDPTGFDYWNILPGQGVYHNPVMIEMGERKKHTGYVTDIITNLCLEWLKEREADKPFCLMYHHKAPHREWEPDDKHAKLYEDTDIPIPETFNDDYKTRCAAAHQQEMTVEQHLNKKDLKIDPPQGLTGQELKKWKYQRYIKDYLRCVASVDDNVGRLLDYLDTSGLTENTIVVYTSDQGFYLGDHGWFDKRFMYEHSLRMPLLVRYPKEIKAGSTNDDIALNLDFAPTFLDLASVTAPGDMQGRSLRPLLEGRTECRTNAAPIPHQLVRHKKYPHRTSIGAAWRTSMYYHYYEYPAVHMVKRHYGIRTKRYKLIHFYYDIDAWELYDLEKDPNELNNVYDDPAYTDIVKQLKTELDRLRKEYKDTTGASV